MAPRSSSSDEEDVEEDDDEDDVVWLSDTSEGMLCHNNNLKLKPPSRCYVATN